MADADPALEAPKYIYKIAASHPKPSWPPQDKVDSAKAVLPASDLDSKSRFIHMSTAKQIPGTLKHFFRTSSRDRNSVFLLKVLWPPVFDDLGLLRWESPDAKICGPREDEGLFPHLYFFDGEEPMDGSNRLWLRKAEVDDVKELVSEEGTEGWEQSLQDLEKWLV